MVVGYDLDHADPAGHLVFARKGLQRRERGIGYYS
jgi:hypothetical protein